MKRRKGAVFAVFAAFAALLMSLQPVGAFAAAASVPLPEERPVTYAQREAYKEELFCHAGVYRTEETALRYRYYLPEEAEGAPLVLFLHGSGERGDDNDSQLNNAVLRPFIEDENSPFYSAAVVAPQCPAKEGGDGWVDLRANGYEVYENYSVDAVAESAECRALVGLVQEMLSRYALDAGRVYVIGVSQGAVATWDLLARHGELFAAAVPIAGVGDVSKAEAYAEIPIYAFHGEQDTIVPYESGTPRLYEAVDAVGEGKMNFVSFTDGAHDIWEQSIVYAGGEGMPSLAEWLFSRRREEASPSAWPWVAAACAAAAVAAVAACIALLVRRRKRESA